MLLDIYKIVINNIPNNTTTNIIDLFSTEDYKRGLLSAENGFTYTGITTNDTLAKNNNNAMVNYPNIEFKKYKLPSDNFTNDTNIYKIGDIWVKRDDELTIGGSKGGKVRTCWHLSKGSKGLVTAGSRSSPQVNIVAQIAKKLNVPCRVHTPDGALSDEVLMAQRAGAEIIQHRAGYNSVIVSRAKKDAEERGWTNIPFGMECSQAITSTSSQIKNIPMEVKRIVVPVGSGMSLAGILTGLANTNRNIPVLGIVVGADPEKRLDKYAPSNWRDMVTLIKSEFTYDKSPKVTEFRGIQLDPIYEAKCINFLQKDDLFWVVGIRASLVMDYDLTEGITPVWYSSDCINNIDIKDGSIVIINSDNVKDYNLIYKILSNKTYKILITSEDPNSNTLSKLTDIITNTGYTPRDLNCLNNKDKNKIRLFVC